MPSISDLNNMNLDQLIKELNRQAEKYNKQITRAKQSGIYTEYKSTYNPNIHRVPIIKGARLASLKKLAPADAEKILIKTYNYREKIARGGYTKSNLNKLKKQFAEAGAYYKAPDAVISEVYDEVNDLLDEASAYHDLYYILIKPGLETGYYHSASSKDLPQITKDSDWKRAMIEENQKINQHVAILQAQDPRGDYSDLIVDMSKEIDKVETEREAFKGIIKGLL